MLTNEVMHFLARRERRAFLSLFIDASSLEYASLGVWQNTLVSLAIANY